MSTLNKAIQVLEKMESANCNGGRSRLALAEERDQMCDSAEGRCFKYREVGHEAGNCSERTMTSPPKGAV